jgi:hypothetical protein
MMHNHCPWTMILQKLIGLQLRMNQSKPADLWAKKLVVAPTKKRGQTSQGASSDENPEGVIDLKEVEDPTSKRRRLIADWSEEEDEEVEEVSGIVASS